MAEKKPAKKPAKTETAKEKLQRLSDTYQYAEASKTYNSPSASTRSNTSGIAFMDQSYKMLRNSDGKADVSFRGIDISKRDRMMLDAGKSTGIKFVSPGKTSIKDIVVKKKLITGMGGNPKTVVKPKTNKK